MDKIIQFLLIVFLILPYRFYSLELSNYLALPYGILVSLLILIIYRQTNLKLYLTFLLFGLFFSVLFNISMLVNLNNYQKIIVKDIVESIKPLLYSLIILSGIAYGYKIKLENLSKFLITFAIVSIIFSSFVFLPYSNVHEIINFFKGRTYSEDWSLTHYLRFSGFMGYPSVFSIWLCFVLLLVYSDENICLFQKLMYLVFIFLGILFSGGRSGLFIMIVSFLLYALMFDFSFRKLEIKKRFFYLFLSFIIFISFSFINLLPRFKEVPAFSYLTMFFEKGIYDDSFSYRINELNLILTTFKFLGYGPNNYFLYNYHGPVETLYFYYFYKFGIFGLAYIFTIISLVIFLLFKGKSSINNAFAVWGLTSIILGIGESIIDEYKSFYIFFFLLGILISKL
jgi:hypothetical protein